MMKFIVEHLEKRLYKWCIIEYTHISEIVGKSNLIFTNVKPGDVKKLSSLGKVYTKSVKSMNLKRICLLDPDVDKTLSKSDSKKFDYILLLPILHHVPRA